MTATQVLSSRFEKVLLRHVTLPKIHSGTSAGTTLPPPNLLLGEQRA